MGESASIGSVKGRPVALLRTGTSTFKAFFIDEAWTFFRNPRISIELVNLRPFFILGEAPHPLALVGGAIALAGVWWARRP